VLESSENQKFMSNNIKSTVINQLLPRYLLANQGVFPRNHVFGTSRISAVYKCSLLTPNSSFLTPNSPLTFSMLLTKVSEVNLCYRY
jgi:hypothetical protein